MEPPGGRLLTRTDGTRSLLGGFRGPFARALDNPCFSNVGTSESLRENRLGARAQPCLAVDSVRDSTWKCPMDGRWARCPPARRDAKDSWFASASPALDVQDIRQVGRQHRCLDLGRRW